MAQQDRINGLVGTLGVKAPVRAATTANITLSGEQTIDGVAVVAGDRVLVKNQTTGAENGIYAVATTAWAREPDFDGPRDVVKGTLVYVTEGTLYAGLPFSVSTSDPIVVGTSSIAFVAGFTGTVTDASSVVNVPAGGVAATDVQAAIDELDTEKAAISGQVFTGAISATNLSGTNTGDEPAASETVPGIVELATTAELRTGTDNTRAPHPAAIFAALGFSAVYESTAQTITAGGQLVLAHGLGRTPKLLQYFAVCINPEFNYAAGEIIHILPPISTTLANTYGLTAKVDITNITIRFGVNATTLVALDATTGLGNALTNANWKLLVKAWG